MLPFSSLNGGGHFKIGKLCVENSAQLPTVPLVLVFPKLAPSHSVFLETLKSVAHSQHLKVCCAVRGRGLFPKTTFALK